MWSKDCSVLLSKGLIIIGFLMTLSIIPFVPEIAGFYDTISGDEPVWLQFTVVVYVVLAFVIMLLFILFRLLNNISKKVIFVSQNTKYLRIISWCCFLIAGILIVLGIWVTWSVLIAFVAGFMGLILRILKNVFEEAVSIRQDNDYTI